MRFSLDPLKMWAAEDVTEFLEARDLEMTIFLDSPVHLDLVRVNFEDVFSRSSLSQYP